VPKLSFSIKAPWILSTRFTITAKSFTTRPVTGIKLQVFCQKNFW
jgi:hypothetical protein